MAEVYERYDLSTIPLLRRICALIYVAWLFAEGLICGIHKFTSSQTSALVGYDLEHSFMYFIIVGLLLVLLHTFIGRQVPKYCFRFITFLHQVTIASMSLWRYACAETAYQAQPRFRLLLMCFCALGETRTFIAGMTEMVAFPNSQQERNVNLV